MNVPIVFDSRAGDVVWLAEVVPEGACSVGDANVRVTRVDDLASMEVSENDERSCRSAV